MKRLTATLAAMGLAVAGLAGSVALATEASAAPSSCSILDTSIYQPPAASKIGAPGDLISCASSDILPYIPGSVPLKAWKVQYSSTNNLGQKVAVSGLVIVPKAAWKGVGTRPIVAFNPGTLGLGTQCAFSKQIAGAYQDEYEGVNLQRALESGAAVAATDGIGYLNGQVHPYVVGENAAHALLDISRTASQVPGAGLTKGTKVGIWGYSEGGQASLWAAQVAKSYAPDVNVVGAAAGGVPGDLKLVAAQLNGGPFAGFAVDAVLGLSISYPNLPFTDLLNDKGKQAIQIGKTNCLYGTLANFVGAKIENFTTKGYSLDQLYALKSADGSTTWGQVVDQQKLGVNIGKPGSGAKYQIGFPTYQYRGIAEEIINTKAENGTRDAYCKAGVTTDWDQGFPGEHLTTDGEAVDNSVKWLSDRFAGKVTNGNCNIPSL